jgi:hypothetical protein
MTRCAVAPWRMELHLVSEERLGKAEGGKLVIVQP